MRTLTISTRFRIVIPKEIREKLRLSPGQKMRALVHGGRIVLTPLHPMKQMRGFLKGINTRLEREADRK